MNVWRYALAACVIALAACNQQPANREAEGSAAPVETPSEATDTTRAEIPPVDASLLGAPNAAFTAIEPSEVGVFGAATILDAVHDLVSGEALEGEANVSLTIREDGDNAFVDIVRDNIPDDSVAAGHVRVEFRREPEGWFPTNAYRRWMCRRGPHANQWSRELCP